MEVYTLFVLFSFGCKHKLWLITSYFGFRENMSLMQMRMRLCFSVKILMKRRKRKMNDHGKDSASYIRLQDKTISFFLFFLVMSDICNLKTNQVLYLCCFCRIMYLCEQRFAVSWMWYQWYTLLILVSPESNQEQILLALGIQKYPENE